MWLFLLAFVFGFLNVNQSDLCELCGVCTVGIATV